MMLKLTEFLFLLAMGLLLQACQKEETPIPADPPPGCIDLSSLKNRQDYYLPFAIRNDQPEISGATLNGEAISFSSGKFINFPENSFNELIIQTKGTSTAKDTFLFTTKTKERENSEWGIRAWTPAPFSVVPLGAEKISMVYPRRFLSGITLPFIFYIREAGMVKPVYCQGNSSTSGQTFNIKRGVGSMVLDASAVTEQVQFSIGGLAMKGTLSRISAPDMILSGNITSAFDIAPNKVVRISGNLTITASGSLKVGEGALMLIDEGVDINLSGPVTFTGTEANPVLVTCTTAGRYWGGFITRVAGGTLLAQHTIFCRSGVHDSSDYQWGHSGRQALFYSGNSTLTLDHCYMTDHIGQVFYSQNSKLKITHCLVQRVQTGGQLNSSELSLQNSIFTDFPDDSGNFKDSDNDGLYLSASNAEISNTTFMFAKDDGLDSGNTEGGVINLVNCWFEACFHEGAALSSGNSVVKKHTFTGCTFTNCSQGIELGFSSPNHLVVADNCLFYGNGIGIRYGDNYDWSSVSGKMQVKNSISKNNDKDVWNMVRMSWSPKLNNLTFENTRISRYSPQYPQLEILKP